MLVPFMIRTRREGEKKTKNISRRKLSKNDLNDAGRWNYPPHGFSWWYVSHWADDFTQRWVASSRRRYGIDEAIQRLQLNFSNSSYGRQKQFMRHESWWTSRVGCLLGPINSLEKWEAKAINSHYEHESLTSFSVNIASLMHHRNLWHQSV